MVRPASPDLPVAHLEPEEARQGQLTGHMRWVLAISLALAVVVIFGVWAFLAERAHAEARALAPPSAERILTI
jgi:hypothetical protein